MITVIPKGRDYISTIHIRCKETNIEAEVDAHINYMFGEAEIHFQYPFVEGNTYELRIFGGCEQRYWYGFGVCGNVIPQTNRLNDLISI